MTSGNNYAFKKALAGERTENISTRKGIGIKTVALLGIVLVTTITIMLNLGKIAVALGSASLVVYVGALILNFILQMIISFVPSTTKVLSIPYAISEGILLGSLMGLLEIFAPGYGITIGGLALVFTVAIFLAATILYATGIVKPTRKFKAIMNTILISIVLVSLIVLILSIFASSFVNMLFENAAIFIPISIFMIIIASIYIVISLDYANKIAEAGVDKKYEWYAAYGITINVIWLFLEIFRLLSYIMSKSDR